jgi:transposase-like protein
LSYERDCSLAKLDKELGLYKNALSSWRREYEKFNKEDFSANDYLKVNMDRQINQPLEKKIKKSDLKFQILKNAGNYLLQERSMVFRYMASNEKLYSIRLMCEVLGLNRGTYRSWKNPVVTEKKKRKILMQKRITSIFYKYKQRYGCVRIAIVLKNTGFEISSSTVYEYMKELGLYSKVKKN